MFALRYRLPLRTAVCFRSGPGCWRIEVGDEIPTRENGRPRSVEAIALDMNRAFETAIRRDPANWFWVHKRWKPAPKPADMNDFEQELSERLQGLREHGLYRELRRVDSPQSARIEIQGRSLLNFSSNDYLGLANHPLLKEAALQAVERYGAGSGASRLICGSLAPFHELEEALAHFKGAKAALTFSTGYAAAGVICALLGKEDFIVTDKLVHACLVDAARLCGAKLRIFAHNDLNDLEEILRWVDHQQPSAHRPALSQDAAVGFPAVISRRPRTLIVTETVFPWMETRRPCATWWNSKSGTAPG